MAGKASKKQKVTEARRETILKAATDVFTVRGFTAATIPEIARAAGVAAGTIYLYYPSKRDLFIAVIKNFIITTPLLTLIDKIPQGDVVTILKDILKERFDLIKNPAFRRVPSFIGDVQRDPELKALWLKDFLQPFLQRMESNFHLMGALGQTRPMEPAVATRAVGGLILGFLMLRIMEGEASPLNKLDQDKVALDIVGFLLHGLSREPEGGKA